MNKKRILLVSPEGFGNGGVQSIMMTIKRNLAGAQVDALLFTNDIRYYDDEFIKLDGIIYRIPIRHIGGIKKIFNRVIGWISIYNNLNKIFINNKYDVIHCNNEIESWICLLSAKKNKIPIRISHHHRSNYLTNKGILYKIYFRIISKIILASSTTVICCSKKTKKDFFGEKINNNKVLIVNNPVDLRKYSVKKCKHTNCELTNVGMYSIEKNQLFLLDVINILKDVICNVHLNLVGFGDIYKKKLEAKIALLKLDKYITLIDGRLENSVLETLKYTDIFLFPSIQEGFGISVIEAQAMNIRCLCSINVPLETNVGLAEYIDIDNPNDWARKILLILNDNSKVVDKEMIKSYSINSFISNIKRIYNI